MTAIGSGIREAAGRERYRCEHVYGEIITLVCISEGVDAARSSNVPGLDIGDKEGVQSEGK